MKNKLTSELKHRRKELQVKWKSFADTAEEKEGIVYEAGLFKVHEMMDSNVKKNINNCNSNTKHGYMDSSDRSVKLRFWAITVTNKVPTHRHITINDIG